MESGSGAERNLGPSGRKLLIATVLEQIGVCTYLSTPALMMVVRPLYDSSLRLNESIACQVGTDCTLIAVGSLASAR